MDLLLLAIILIGNVLLKSANDKKKIDNSRKKRGSSRIDRPETTNKKGNFFDQLEKEIEKEFRENTPGVKRETKKTTLETDNRRPVDRKPIEDLKKPVIQSSYNRRVEEGKKSSIAKADIELQEKSTKGKNKLINSKNDIVKGIIFSEILAEPLSVRKDRRSI